MKTSMQTVLDFQLDDGQSPPLSPGPTWLQGRSVYGGLQAAIGVRAMKLLLDDDIPLKTLQTTFMAPVPEQGFSVQARILRQGKNTVHCQAELMDGEQTLASFIGVFGRSRESGVDLSPTQQQPNAEGDTRLGFVDGLTPAFLQHFDNRLRAGLLPFAGQACNFQRFELAILDDGPFCVEHLVALADVPPPVALCHFSQFTPASSLTWTLELVQEDFSQFPLQGWVIESELVDASRGYTSQSNTVWSPEGRLAALSRQCMVVFA